MTLLLTCVTHRFAVQASDRRLTNTRGQPVEELANKATLLCNFASFAYTGLAQASRLERTDQLMMRSLAKSGVKVPALVENLRVEATGAIRQLPLPSLTPSQKLKVRRTSFVGCGFIGMRNPAAFGREPTLDELHPFIAVVSNAQDLSEAWRPVADQEFTTHIGFLDLAASFKLHVAGQQLFNHERVDLERSIRRCLPRIDHPEPIARLLARTIRCVSERNKAVGPNVMCTFVRRFNAAGWDGNLFGGPVPLIPELQEEASYFIRMKDGPPSKWIFSPGDSADLLHYGPNFSCDGHEMTGLLLGPPSLVAEAEIAIRAGLPPITQNRR